MKRKYLSFVLLLAAVALVAGCGKSNYPKAPEAGNTSTNPNAIPYLMASNYFVRNSVLPSVTISKRIDTKTEFDEYFGVATTMGSQPTAIDFDKQYVLAVILPETNDATTLKVANVTSYRGIITLSYNREVGQEQTFTVRPLLLVLVDRKYSGEVLIVEK